MASPRSDRLPEVLFFGRLEHRKGVHLLAQAACRLIDRGIPARFRFIGGDTDTGPRGTSMLAHLRAIIGESRLSRFEFEVGHFPRNRIGPAVRAATICCFPSLWENFPYACLEAMALRGVVIGSDSGGMADIIEREKSGLLFKGGDVDALAAVIERALKDDALRTSLSEAAPRRIAALCDPQAIARATADFVQSLSRGPDTPDRHGKPPEIAVLVVSDGDREALDRTLESVRFQSQLPNEIVIAMEVGAAPDRIESMAAKVRARMVRADRPGIPAARNAALHAARSPLFIPLVAGDELRPDAVAIGVKAIASRPKLAYVTGLVGFGGTLEHPAGVIAPLADDRDLLTVLNLAGPAIALFRRDPVLAAGGYDEQTGFEEWLLYAALARAGSRGDSLPIVLGRLGPRSAEARPRGSPQDFELARTRLAAKYPDLAADSDRAARYLAGETRHCDHKR